MSPFSQIAPNPRSSVRASVRSCALPMRRCALATALLFAIGLAVPSQHVGAAELAALSPAEAAPEPVELALPTLEHGEVIIALQDCARGGRDEGAFACE